jgi:hypothetical protein
MLTLASCLLPAGAWPADGGAAGGPAARPMLPPRQGPWRRRLTVALTLAALAATGCRTKAHKPSPLERTCAAICDAVIGCEKGPFLDSDEQCVRECVAAWNRPKQRKHYECLRKAGKHCDAVDACYPAD